MAIYRMRTKRYQNKVDGVRYNVSFSLYQTPKEIAQLDEAEFEQWRYRQFADHPQYYIPTMGTGKLAHKVHPSRPRDQSSIYRSIREIRDLGVSNDWDYFFTFTLDPKKWDRSDYMIPAEKIMKFFANQRRGDNGYDAKLVMIPELHKDRVNYHFHGMIAGLPQSLIRSHPYAWCRSQGYVDFPPISKRFGLVTLSPVQDTAAVVYYCLKYVNKDIGLGKTNDGRRLYFASRGLNRPQVVDEIHGLDLDLSRRHLHKLQVTDYGTGFQRRMTQEDKDKLFKQILGMTAGSEGDYNAQIPESHWQGSPRDFEEDGGYYPLFAGPDAPEEF